MKFIKKITIPRFPKQNKIESFLNSIGLNDRFLNKKNGDILSP